MKVAKLDKATVDALAGDDKPYVAWAGDLPGFGVAVRPNGIKSFIAQYDFGGRRGTTRRVTIGRYGKPWTPKEARDRAKVILDDAKRGIDYAEAKAKRRAELTVAELCAEYLEHGCDHKKASTIATDKGRIERHIKPLLGNLKIGDVGAKELEKFKRDVASGKGIEVKGGKGTATRTLRLIGGIFTYAVKCKYLTENPRKGVAVYADRKGKRYLSPTEFQRLGDVLREAETIGLPWQLKDGPKAKHTPKMAETAREVVSPYAVAAIRLLMLTGCRLSEILTLKWAHVNFERGLLALPDSKTGEKEVLLGAAALKILTDLPRVKGNPYVIVGEVKNKPRSDLKRPWARITAYAGLNTINEDGSVKPLRLHDLRHSFASVGVASNLSLSIVGKLLGHASPATTARYAHIADTAERRALNEIENTIAAGMGLIETAEVIPLKQDAA